MRKRTPAPPVSAQEGIKEDVAEARELVADLTEIREHDTSVGPVLSGGDVDARWDQAESSGEETAGGSVPTPDQNVVDEIGKAIGVTYQEGEPLRAGEKEHERDLHRWELDPASAEDYLAREREQLEQTEEILKMHHDHREKRHGKGADHE